MSVIIAIPQPSDPKPVPNRRIRVSDNKEYGHSLDLIFAMCEEPENRPEHRIYLLPGDQLAAALAAREEAIQNLMKLYESNGEEGLEAEDLVLWNTHKAVRELTPKGTNP